ncbi:MAG: hypothetical protein Q9187_006861 [Circinaria calcarea]
MDPVSFTASLVTLIGAVTVSSHKIYALQKRFKNAPKDVEKLVQQLQTFRSLLKELEVLQNVASSQDTLQQVWVDSVALMRQDIENLDIMVSKVEPLLRKQSSSLHVGLLIRQMLSGKEIAEYHEKINVHCVRLNTILTIVYGRQIDQLSHSTDQLSDETKAGFHMVLSQFANVVSTREAKDLEALSRLDDLTLNGNFNSQKLDEVFQQQARVINMSEAGLQAVHSSLMSEGHEVTQAMLSEHKSQLDQIARILGTSGHNLYSPSKGHKASHPTTTETSILWKYFSYNLPIGNLNIELSQARQSISSKYSASQDHKESSIAVTFAPPWWLSSFAFQYVMKVNYNLIANQWRWSANLNLLTINHDPFFVKAVEEWDVEGIQESFRKGLARKTDYILDRWGNPDPWQISLLSSHSPLLMRWSSPESNLFRAFSLLEFMVKEGIPNKVFALFRILCYLSGYSYSELLNSDMFTISHKLFRGHLKTYAQYGNDLFTGDTLFLRTAFIESHGTIDWIPDLLFHSSESSEPWLVDDLSPLAICLIGTLANADTEFRGRLKQYLASYYSPFRICSAHVTDRLFDCTFNPDSILTHFCNLEPYLRRAFLAILCRTDSPSMLKPFMDIGVDINNNSRDTNMLANAATAGNTDVVSMLLDAGANGALAINDFLYKSKHLPEARFKELLQLLVKGARSPVPNDLGRDPLDRILGSSRALSLCPEAPEILLRQGAFNHTLLSGGDARFYHSYMFGAIMKGDDNLMKLLLQQGAQVDAQIIDLFLTTEQFPGAEVDTCTWLTLSVLCGVASCVSILIQHGADVTASHGSGRSAIHIAKSNAVAFHPRIFDAFRYRHSVTAEKDIETLAVVKRAFDLKFHGTKNSEDYIGPSGQINCPPATRREKFILAIQRAHKKILEFILTRFIPDRARVLWRLSFFEALLMRSIYVLSYFLLFVVEAVAFATGQKPIPKPSRTFLSSVAVLMLAIIWGASFHFET